MNGYQQYFKAKKAQVKKKKGKKLAFLYSFVATVLTAGSVWYLIAGEDQAAKILNHVEISLLGSAQAQTQDEAKSSDTSPKTEEKKSPDVTQVKKTWTDEEVTLFTKLDERKKQLDAREANLNKVEEELQKQKEELEKRLAQLEEMRGSIAAKLDNKVKADEEKVTALVSVYSNMKPAQAAKIIEGLNEELAVEVLTKMKNKNAAEILNTMDSEKAKRLSEKFAGYKEANLN